MGYYAIIVFGGLGLLFAVGLAIAGRLLRTDEDGRKSDVLRSLPGVNCGACGFAGCEGFAGGLISGKAGIEKCASLTEESLKDIERMLGLTPGEIVRKKAVVYCSGGKNCSGRYGYIGVETCRASGQIFGGHKKCDYACLSFGDCSRVCPFGAITYKKGEVPVVNRELCTGCGICVDVCPKKIISLVEEKYPVHIRCSSKDNGNYVRQVCKTGCIACGVCVKVCPKKAITLKDNLAVIDYGKCNACGLCVERCPANTIERALPK
ncbi:MAG: RnfABCDGE type electron transport complex subunit B [Elusimicrobiota bacterium]